MFAIGLETFTQHAIVLVVTSTTHTNNMAKLLVEPESAFENFVFIVPSLVKINMSSGSPSP